MLFSLCRMKSPRPTGSLFVLANSSNQDVFAVGFASFLFCLHPGLHSVFSGTRRFLNKSPASVLLLKSSTHDIFEHPDSYPLPYNDIKKLDRIHCEVSMHPVLPAPLSKTPGQIGNDLPSQSIQHHKSSSSPDGGIFAASRVGALRFQLGQRFVGPAPRHPR